MSPIKTAHDGNVLDGSGNFTPRALVIDTVQTPTSGSSQQIELFMKNFAQYTQSVVDIALAQGRHQDIARDEKRQTKERSRWSKYHSSFVAIGEDQNRVLQATIKEKDEVGERLSQAKISGEKAIRTIATAILATDSSSQVSFSQDATSTESHGDEITSIKNDIRHLRNSNVDLKSKYHRLVEEQDVQVKRQERRDKDQERQEKDLSDLWNDAVRKHPYRDFEDEVERRFEDQSARIRALVEKAEEVKPDQLALQIQKLRQTSQSFDSKLQNLKEKTKKDFSKLDVESTKSRKNISSLQKFQAETESAIGELKESSAHTTDADASIRNTVSIHKDSLARVKQDVETLKQQLETQGTASTRAEESREDDVSQTKDVSYISENIQPATENFPQAVHTLDSEHESLDKVVTANEQLGTGQESLVARLNVVEQLCKQKSLGGSGSVDIPMPESEPIPQSLTSPNVQQLEKRVTDVEDDLQAVHEKFKRRDEQQDQRYETILQEIDDYYTSMMKLDKLIRTVQSELDSKTQVQDQLRSDLQALENRVATEQSVHSTSIAQIREDVRSSKEISQSSKMEHDQLRSQISDQQIRLETIATDLSQCSTSMELVRSDTTSLKTTTGSLSSSRDAQQQILNKMQQILPELQNRFETLAAPSPQVDVPKNEVNPKLEALESDLRLHRGEVAHKVNAFENFLSTQQERWNNMTTEPMIQAIVYKVQQIPPLWNLKTTLDGHESRIFSLEGYLKGFTMNVNQRHAEVMSSIQAAKANIKDVEEKFRSQLAIAMQPGKTVESFQANLSELEQKVANLQQISSEFDLLRTELFALKQERSTLEAYKAETLTEKQRMENEIQTLQTGMSQPQEARAVMQGQIDGLQNGSSELRDEMRQELSKVPTESNLKKMREELQEELREELGKDFYSVHEVTRERVEKVEGLVAELNEHVKTGLARVKSLGTKTESLENNTDSVDKKANFLENDTKSLDERIEDIWVTVKKELVSLTTEIRELKRKHTATPANAGSDEDEPEIEIEDTQDRFVDAEESPSPERQQVSSTKGSSRRGGHRPGAGRKSTNKKRARHDLSNSDDASDDYTDGSLSSPPIRWATSSRRRRTALARGSKKIKTDEPAAEDVIDLATPSSRRSRGRPRREGTGAGH
ncbi:MAG: hypothetical protein L6R37_004017 [Teloschistes peruensis]|nr:MAG: hypothetical protein L6R37_004017 [Teloschistes peruensis]